MSGAKVKNIYFMMHLLSTTNYIQSAGPQRTEADGRNDEGVTYYTVTMKHSASTAFFGNNMHFDCQNKRNPFLPTFNAASIQFSLLSQIIYIL